jgi:S1-C subfamily serine protease
MFRKALLIGCVAVLFTGVARAQDAGLREELKKIFEGGRKSLVERFDKSLAESEERFLAAILKTVEEKLGARVAKLEADLKERDRRIAELEARVKELTTPAPAPKASPTFLGVGHMDVPQDLRAKLKLDAGGALVTHVVAEGPAAAAGLEAGDVIVELNGAAVSSADLAARVGGFKPDQEVNITYVRDGNRQTKGAKLVDREKFFAAQEEKRKAAAAPKPREPIALGILVKEVPEGLVVDSVDEGHTGAVAGLKAGDRITQLNGKELKTLDEIGAELKKVLEGDTFKLVYVRGDETITVTVIGAKGKDGVKLVAQESQKPKPKEEPRPKEEPKAERKAGFLGVTVALDAAGVLVDDVVPETAAAVAGVQKGDVLKSVNGKPVADVDQLKAALKDVAAGDKITMVVVRAGKDVELKDVELKAQGEKVAAAAAAPVKPKEEPKPAPPPAPPVKKKGALGILASESIEGKIVVRTVNPGGAAEKSGLKVGDIILKINDKAVTSFEDISSTLRALFAGDQVTIRVQREAKEEEVKVTLGEAI